MTVDNEVEFDISSFDASVWTKGFCEQFPNMDESTMLSWFANAIMAGYDYKAREEKPRSIIRRFR